MFPPVWEISTGAIGGSGPPDIVKLFVLDGSDTALVWTLSRALVRQCQVPGATDWVQVAAVCHADW